MGLISALSKPLAKWAHKRQSYEALNASEIQEKIFHQLISKAQNTLFGRDHSFEKIKNHNDFSRLVPLRDYEALKPYINRVIKGEKNVLWPGQPMYMSKTSGTTSGIKYIPITRNSIPNHIESTRNAMFSYIAETGKADFLAGKLIFISGSPALQGVNGIKTGRLSGIVNHHVPGYLKVNQLPTWKTNCIEDFELKIEKIVEETLDKNMTMISGIPPWVQMYFDQLTEHSGKKIGELYKNFSLFIYGGVNFEPYRKKFEESVGRSIDSIELYPASEGFIAFQDSQNSNDLLLNLNSGIFFEFVPANEIFNEHPTRLTIAEVKTGVNYAIVINSNAGLWGYVLGDTVKFTSLSPYKIIVTGRIKHFISAFGEHVIGEEVEQAIATATEKKNARVVEFTVAPVVSTDEKPHHQWLIEFEKMPEDVDAFANELDLFMQQKNIYYKDLRSGNILEILKIVSLPSGTFNNYMRSMGKLGGQNKIPHLSNDRNIADALLKQ